MTGLAGGVGDRLVYRQRQQARGQLDTVSRPGHEEADARGDHLRDGLGCAPAGPVIGTALDVRRDRIRLAIRPVDVLRVVRVDRPYGEDQDDLPRVVVVCGVDDGYGRGVVRHRTRRTGQPVGEHLGCCPGDPAVRRPPVHDVDLTDVPAVGRVARLGEGKQRPGARTYHGGNPEAAVRHRADRLTGGEQGALR